jgi:hypothetical protein
MSVISTQKRIHGNKVKQGILSLEWFVLQPHWRGAWVDFFWKIQRYTHPFLKKDSNSNSDSNSDTADRRFPKNHHNHRKTWRWSKIAPSDIRHHASGIRHTEISHASHVTQLFWISITSSCPAITQTQSTPPLTIPFVDTN